MLNNPESGEPNRIERTSRRIPVFGATVEVVRLQPEHPAIPEAVLIAPGWNETPEIFEDTLQVIANEGHDVLTVKHARRGGDIRGASQELRERFPEVELRKSLALISALALSDVEKADVVAHSEGGYNALIAAAIAPEKFRNMVLINPAGIIGRDSFPSLFGRFTVGHIKMGLAALFGEERAGRFRAQKETIKEFAKNPVRALKEAVAISAADTVGLIQELRRQGIKIAVMANVDDPVFPMARMQETLRQNQLDGFLSLRGDHYDINVDAPRYTKAALGLLNQMARPARN